MFRLLEKSYTKFCYFIILVVNKVKMLTEKFNGNSFSEENSEHFCSLLAKSRIACNFIVASDLIYSDFPFIVYGILFLK